MRGSETFAPVRRRRRSQSLSGMPLEDFSKRQFATLPRCRKSSGNIMPLDNDDMPTDLVSVEKNTSSHKRRRRSSCDFSKDYLYYGLVEVDKENFPPIAVSMASCSEEASSCNSSDWNGLQENFQPSISAADEQLRGVIAEETEMGHLTELVAIKVKVPSLQGAEVCKLMSTLYSVN